MMGLGNDCQLIESLWKETINFCIYVSRFVNVKV